MADRVKTTLETPPDLVGQLSLAGKQLCELSRALHAGGKLMGAREWQVLSLLVETSGTLIADINVLLTGGSTYSAAVLLRQLVELEMLANRFAEDPEAIVAWVDSGPRHGGFEPRRLYGKADPRKSVQDHHYRLHCQMGGHLTTESEGLFPTRNRNAQQMSTALRSDTAEHAAKVIHWTLSALTSQQARSSEHADRLLDETLNSRLLDLVQMRDTLTEYADRFKDAAQKLGENS